MVDGSLRCIGTEQELKSRFGKGFQLQVKLTEPNPLHDMEELRSMLRAGWHRKGSSVSPQGGGQGGFDKAPSRSLKRSSSMWKSFRLAGKGELSETEMSLADAKRACTVFGRPDRADLFDVSVINDAGSKVAESGSAWLLANALATHGIISSESFIRWWVIEDWSDGLLKWLSTLYGGAPVKLIEQHEVVVRFSLPQGRSIGDIFAIVEAAKEDMHIEEYSVGQTTLEQIFLGFAKTQADEQDSVRGLTERTDDDVPVVAESKSHV